MIGISYSHCSSFQHFAICNLNVLMIDSWEESKVVSIKSNSQRLSGSVLGLTVSLKFANVNFSYFLLRKLCGEH